MRTHHVRPYRAQIGDEHEWASEMMGVRLAIVTMLHNRMDLVGAMVPDLPAPPPS